MMKKGSAVRAHCSDPAVYPRGLSALVGAPEQLRGLLCRHIKVERCGFRRSGADSLRAKMIWKTRPVASAPFGSTVVAIVLW